MKLSRRELLIMASALSAVPLSGCERVVTEVTQRLGERIPDHIKASTTASIDPQFHLLSRAGFGAWPGDLEQIRSLGTRAWLDQQLSPEKIDDGVCQWRVRRFESLHMDPGTCYEFKKSVLRDEIVRHSILRAVYSKRQLFEAMVEFWSDHLNINIEKGDCIYLKPADDRLVVRAHALGNFRDLIRASATSPAMLVYLDGNENRKESAGGIPNENYARELLELHTLGVHGGYTQHDVLEVARCLTGWHLHTPWQRAKVYFDEKRHDDGEKHVLGHVIAAGGGAQDLERVVDIVCHHPSTALRIATKMVAHFVSDTPPPHLVRQVAAQFTRTGGDIKSAVRTILTSTEFQNSPGVKLKRPFRFVVTCLRTLGADTFAHKGVVEYLSRMGQGPFQYPTPDGYPDKAEHWVGTLLWRWNFALAVASNRMPAVKVSLDQLETALGGTAEQGLKPELLLPHFLGRRGTTQEIAALTDYIGSDGLRDAMHRAELVGLILASPAFQRY